MEKRTLLKVFGIRIDIIVHSLVGKINPHPFRLLTISDVNEESFVPRRRGSLI